MDDSRASIDFPLTVIPLRHAHHAQASGYERITPYLGGDTLPEVRDWTFWRRALARAGRGVTLRSGSQWYHRGSFVRECQAARCWFATRGGVFHFLYGENSYRYFGALKRLGRRHAIVCTYHTPPVRFGEVVREHSHLQTIDALIVLSSMAVPFFSELVGAERVVYIPRGVDTDYFAPLPQPPRNARFEGLFVGTHLRDFTTLAAAARQLAHRDDIHFTVVTAPKYFAALADLEHVRLRSGISDTELLRLYQTADALVLPLADATANNVVVEAIACGLPVIATDLQGVRDYVDARCARLTPHGDAEALAAAVAAFADAGDAERAALRTEARRQALEFSLPASARRVRAVYAQALHRADLAVPAITIPSS